MPAPSNPTSKHELANAAYLQGKFEEAIALQCEVINEHLKNGKQAVSARKLMALYLYSAGQLDGAIALLKVLEQEIPTDSEILENIGVMLRQSGQYVDAVKYLLKAHEMSPKKANICDGLAHCFYTLKEPSQTQKFGRLSLELKDAEASLAKTWPIPDCDPPEFEPQNRDRNIISFSLFGNNPRYLHGALRNARLAPDLYPNWTCRFYCDPRVPKAVIQELKSLNSQVVMRNTPGKFYEGLLWRFEVIDDPSVDRFLVRDCDSVINIKERVAVDEWIKSPKWFHMMRDFPSHTEMVLAGMWGGISGVFPPLKGLVKEFKPQTAATRTYDQHLLREMVWPTMRQSVLIHDSIYTGCLGSIPFPAVGQLPEGRHVGQNEAAIIDRKKLHSSMKPNRGEDLERFFLLGLPGSGTTYTQRLLNAHPTLRCRPEQHLTTLWKSNEQFTKHYQSVITRIDHKAEKQGHDLDLEKIQNELYTTWLEHLFSNYTDPSVTHVGLHDNQLDTNLPYHAKLFPQSKFIFVTRDPRDVVVSVWLLKKRHDPGFDRDGSQLTVLAEAVGKQWNEKLRNVQAFNQALPGRIELVRYEDIMSLATRQNTLNRLFGFLKLPASETGIKTCFEKIPTPIEMGDQVGAWKDALSIFQIDLIQQTSGKLMKLLQYQVCPIDHRSVEPSDTILPS